MGNPDSGPPRARHNPINEACHFERSEKSRSSLGSSPRGARRNGKWATLIAGHPAPGITRSTKRVISNAVRNLALLLGVLLAVLVKTTRFQLIPRMSWLFDIRQDRRIVPTPEHGNDLKGQTSGRAKAHPPAQRIKGEEKNVAATPTRLSCPAPQPLCPEWPGAERWWKSSSSASPR